MKCIRCGKQAVIKLQQGPLCGKCFVEYFQKKVYRTVRKYRLFTKSDTLCFALSGGKDSLAVAYVISQIARKQRQKTFAIGVDEGIKGYRKKQLQDMKRFCKGLGIQYHIFSFKEEYGLTNEQLMQRVKARHIDMSRCTMCGVMRRRILNREAARLGATKMVVGHNLDDEAESVMMNLLRRNIRLMARLGPIAGVIKSKGFVPRVKPLYLCREKEIETYSKLKKFPVVYKRCPYAQSSYREIVRNDMINFEKKHNKTKESIINWFLKILPELKKGFKREEEMTYCTVCGEPSQKEVCNACTILGKLENKKI